MDLNKTKISEGGSEKERSTTLLEGKVKGMENISVYIVVDKRLEEMWELTQVFQRHLTSPGDWAPL